MKKKKTEWIKYERPLEWSLYNFSQRFKNIEEHPYNVDNQTKKEVQVAVSLNSEKM